MAHVIDMVWEQAHLPGLESRLCRQQRRLVKRLGKDGLRKLVDKAVPKATRSALGSGNLDLVMLAKIRRPSREMLLQMLVYVDFITFKGTKPTGAYFGSGSSREAGGARLRGYEKDARRAQKGVVRQALQDRSRHLDSALLPHATMNMRIIANLPQSSKPSEIVLLEGLFADFFGTVSPDPHDTGNSESQWRQHEAARPATRKEPSYMPLNSTSPLAQGSGQESGSLWSRRGQEEVEEHRRALRKSIGKCAVWTCDHVANEDSRGWVAVVSPARSGSKLRQFFRDVPEAKGLHLCKRHVYRKMRLKDHEINTLAGLQRVLRPTKHQANKEQAAVRRCHNKDCVPKPWSSTWCSALGLFPNDPAAKGVWFCDPCYHFIKRRPTMDFAETRKFTVDNKFRYGVDTRHCAVVSCGKDCSDEVQATRGETLFPGEPRAKGSWFCRKCGDRFRWNRRQGGTVDWDFDFFINKVSRNGGRSS